MRFLTLPVCDIIVNCAVNKDLTLYLIFFLCNFHAFEIEDCGNFSDRKNLDKIQQISTRPVSDGKGPQTIIIVLKVKKNSTSKITEKCDCWHR